MQKGRVHKRQEPSGGWVVNLPQYTSVCFWSGPGRFTLRRLFQGPGFQASRRGPQTPKAWQLWWLMTFGVCKNVCCSRGCQKSETGTACSKNNLPLQTSIQKPTCSHYVNMTATIMNERMCFQALKGWRTTVLFHLQSHNPFHLQVKPAKDDVTCKFLTFFLHRFLDVLYLYISDFAYISEQIPANVFCPLLTCDSLCIMSICVCLWLTAVPALLTRLYFENVSQQLSPAWLEYKLYDCLKHGFMTVSLRWLIVWSALWCS